ncbi:hypothetical protein J6590_058345 [Homalodisca vitripennis]|nr:hypothetical protein J6590_058345 [Homalodisca vitripennis]
MYLPRAQKPGTETIQDGSVSKGRIDPIKKPTGGGGRTRDIQRSHVGTCLPLCLLTCCQLFCLLAASATLLSQAVFDRTAPR